MLHHLAVHKYVFYINYLSYHFGNANRKKNAIMEIKYISIVALESVSKIITHFH